MIKEAINEIYVNVINIILNDIDEKDKEEVANNYLNYLYLMYSDKNFNEQNYDKMVKILSEIEKEKWEKRDKDSKLYYFKKDASFDIINNISKKAYSLAVSYLEGNNVSLNQEEVDGNINILINQLDNVSDFNKDEAKRLVSEGILDFEYAMGKHEDITSFRIGHIKNKKL